MIFQRVDGNYEYILSQLLSKLLKILIVDEDKGFDSFMICDSF